MADLSDFDHAEAGIIRESLPTVRFDFKPGSEIGTAEFVIEGAGEAQTELDRWAALMLGLDVGTMRLLEVLEVRAWGRDPETGEPYRYVKCRVARQSEGDRAAKEATDRWLDRHPVRPRKAAKALKGAQPCGMWWPVTDTQLGKGGEERFGGISETMARLDWAADEFLRWTERQRHAYTPDRIVIPLAGDMTEGCHGSYDNQQFITSLNAADQLELAIAAVDRVIQRAVERAPEIILTGVASNHDRQSKVSSKENITDAWDDRTFVLLRSLARVYQYRPGFQHVRVVMPQQPHAAVIDDGHLIVGTIHGHKPKFKGTAPNSMWEWWKADIAARRDTAPAQVLLAGHYHHAYTLGPQSGRILIGLPSLDGGSAYFEAMGGDWSMPGIRPFVTTRQGVRELDTLVWPEDIATAQRQVGGLIA